MKCIKLILTGLLLFFLSGCSSVAVREQLDVEQMNDGLWSYNEITEDSQYTDALLKEGTRSVSFWIRPADNAVDAPILRIGDANRNLTVYSRGYDNETFTGLRLEYTDGTNTEVLQTTTVLKTNRWNYLVLNLKKDYAQLFVDGNSVLEGTITTNVQSDTLTIGAANQNGMNGRISALTLGSTKIVTEEARSVYESCEAAVLLDTVEFKDQDHLQRSLWFDSNTVEGYALNWEVLDPEVMDTRGIILDLDQENEARAIAHLSTEHASASKLFVFHIAGNGTAVRIEEDRKSLDATIEGVLFSKTVLPDTLAMGSSVTYEIERGDARIEDNVLIKTTEEERTSVVLHATLQLDEETLEKTYEFTLLEEAYGYVMAYFDESETVYLALSEDGRNWIKTDIQVTAETGSQRLRDPMLARAKEGDFLLAVTQGFDYPSIYLFDSDDLIGFENERLVLLDVPDEGLGMSGERAWAPFVFYDNEKQVYRLLFSDPHDEIGKIYCSESTDLETFSYPTVFFDTGYPVIDATLFVQDGQYCMLYKDERKAAQTIYYALGKDLDLGNFKAYDVRFLNLQRGLEGPFAFQTKDGWMLYCDQFSAHTFFAGRFEHLDGTEDVQWLSEEEYTLPAEDVRHGSVLTLTQKEYERLSIKE